MNSLNKFSAKTPVHPIQFSHALCANQGQTEPPVSLARINTFRLAPVRLGRGSRLEITENSREAPVPLPTPTTETGKAAMAPAEEPQADSFDFLPEQLLHRSQTITAVLEEALQRSEWSQRRFWGMNE
jgi:hypothetical protein